VTVGFYSPLPPVRTGVADYAAALLTELERLCEVRVNAPGEVCLYHLGNNRLHRQIYFQALRRPGVAVLHDAVLNHLLLGCLDRDAYVSEFVYNYGEWSRALACELWGAAGQCAHDPRFFDRALVRRVAESSRAVIVHNAGAARIVAAHAPGARIVEIPHLARPPGLPDSAAVRAWRDRHGISPRTFLFGVFGYLRESKRLASVLRALETVRGAGRDAALLVAGEFVSSDLARAIAPLLAQPGVLHLPYAEENEFRLRVSAVDAGINLRYPSAGETSGITIRLMAAAKPVLLTAGEENAGFPEAACIRVDSGVAEARMLAEYMTWLAASREAAREIGRRAVIHIEAFHSPEVCARRYWEVLSSC
jgi:glycosyltransferase involved in cell wall biosynthesis